MIRLTEESASLPVSPVYLLRLLVLLLTISSVCSHDHCTLDACCVYNAGLRWLYSFMSKPFTRTLIGQDSADHFAIRITARL